MNIIGRYFILKYKCCIKHLLKSAVLTIIVFFLLLIGIVVVSFGIQRGQILPKVKVGMVIPESEGLIKKAVQFASSMDSIENICDFYYMEEAEAREKFETGELQVVVILPVNFYQDVYQGINTSPEILMAAKDDVSGDVFKELVISGVSYLQMGEAGVYTILDMASEEPILMDYSQVGDFVARYYVMELLDRMDIYEEKMISPLGEINYSEYIVVTFLLIILLIMGTNFSVLYQKNEKNVEQKLKAEGISCYTITLVKIMIMSCCLWLIWLLCYGGTWIFTSVAGSKIVSWNAMIFFYAFVLCVSIAGFFHLVYEAAQNTSHGAILLLFLNISMILCSGLIVPQAYLSETVEKIGNYTPTALWSHYLQIFLFNTMTIEIIGMVLMVIVLEIAAGVVIVWKNL